MTDEPMTALDAALLAYSQDELNAMDDSSLQLLGARVARELETNPQPGADAGAAQADGDNALPPSHHGRAVLTQGTGSMTDDKKQTKARFSMPLIWVRLAMTP